MQALPNLKPVLANVTRKLYSPILHNRLTPHSNQDGLKSWVNVSIAAMASVSQNAERLPLPVQTARNVTLAALACNLVKGVSPIIRSLDRGHSAEERPLEEPYCCD